jgi:hypothetical protein
MPYHLLSGDDPGAFVMAVSPFVAGTPKKIMVIEIDRGVVPAALAAVSAVNPVRRLKLANRQRITADNDHGLFTSPGQPGQAAGKPDEKLGVAQKGYTLRKRPAPGKVLRLVGDLVPGKTHANGGLSVNGQHPIA